MKRLFLMLVGVGLFVGGCAEEQGPRVINGCVIEPGTVCKNAPLAGVSLVGEDLSGADFSGAVLQGADLSFVDLSGAELSITNLAGARLVAANMSGAQLFKANLLGADLGGADIDGVNWSDAVCPDGVVANTAMGCLGHLAP